MYYFCCDERRRNVVKNHSTLNGIDFLEVKDNQEDPYEKRQRTLLVYFIKDLVPGSLNKDNVLIEGGERIQNIKVVNAVVGDIGSPPLTSPPDIDSNVLVVEVLRPGDFSTYTMRIVQDAEHKDPPVGFDPILSAVDFSFKVACPSDFDCKKETVCPKEPVSQLEINYLAKDYASFRQLILDRMAVLMPEWLERNPADPGIALVEILAYVGDYLGYQQDAVATEAYLGTARRRISVRRHARLVDYFMHDGSNARVWVQLRVRDDIKGLELKKNNTKFLTHTNITRHIISLKSKEYVEALAENPEIFELMDNIKLYSDHNEIKFYTWGARECCLPKGATRATLRGRFENLKKGDILILSEILGPRTGKPEDADPTNRYAVRLTEVSYKEDPISEEYPGSPPISSPPVDNSIPLTEIKWHPDDALPSPLCISARIGTDYFKDVSVAFGNVVLADHGLTIEDETIGKVPDPDPALTKVSTSKADRCDKQVSYPTPPRFRPKLQKRLLTHRAPYDQDKLPVSAKATMEWSMRDHLPAITLKESDVEGNWVPRRDLLNSSPDRKEFVVEIDTGGTAYIRFGDNQLGARPVSGAEFKATYRVGNGVHGNVGAETIVHIVSDDPGIVTELNNPVITKVWNPLPAKGGREHESIEQVRQKAPYAFRTQERAVTAEDYEGFSKRCDPDIQRARATLRWTGSWHTVFITADRLGGEAVDAKFENELRKCLERYRMAGHDLEVDGPHFVSLEIEMVVCVKPGYFSSDVRAALLEILSNRILPDRRRGVFHPDNFTFGQTVYLSPIYAVVQAVQGVSSIKIVKFQRQGIDSNEWIDAGKIELDRLEIARLDNDPNYPERGVLVLDVRGVQ